MQLRGLGERCELPQRGLRCSPSQNQFLCILALKSKLGGNNFNDSPENQLTKLLEVIFKDTQFDI